MMDRNALAKSSAKCWKALGKGLMREAQTLYTERWEQDGEQVAAHLFDAAYDAHMQADEQCDQRAYYSRLVF